MDDWRTFFVNTNDDEADLLSEVLPFGKKRRRFFRKALIHC